MPRAKSDKDRKIFVLDTSVILLPAVWEERRDRGLTLAELGAEAGVHDVANAVYAAVDPAVRPAAELSVAAQLEYLRGR